MVQGMLLQRIQACQERHTVNNSNMYVKKINEKNENILTWEGNPEQIVRSAQSENIGVLLQGVDLYQDTYFNTKQLAMLRSELVALSSKFTDAEKDVTSLLNFISKVTIEEYLVFVGD